MMRFSFQRIIVEMHFSFFATAALICLLGSEHLFWQVFTACLAHELGHILMMALFRRHTQKMILCGIGVTICPVQVYGAYWQDILILLAGPTVNLLIGGFLSIWQGTTSLVWMHLGLGVFNLLPYRQLDGGSILQAVFSAWDLELSHIEGLLNAISVLTSLVSLWILFCSGSYNFSLFCMIVYLQIMQFSYKST